MKTMFPDEGLADVGDVTTSKLYD